MPIGGEEHIVCSEPILDELCTVPAYLLVAQYSGNVLYANAFPDEQTMLHLENDLIANEYFAPEVLRSLQVICLHHSPEDGVLLWHHSEGDLW